MSLNCNGLLTSIQRRKKKIQRYKVMCKHIVAEQQDIVGLQEPHNLTSSQEHKVSKYFAKF